MITAQLNKSTAVCDSSEKAKMRTYAPKNSEVIITPIGAVIFPKTVKPLMI